MTQACEELRNDPDAKRDLRPILAELEQCGVARSTIDYLFGRAVDAEMAEWQVDSLREQVERHDAYHREFMRAEAPRYSNQCDFIPAVIVGAILGASVMAFTFWLYLEHFSHGI